VVVGVPDGLGATAGMVSFLLARNQHASLRSWSMRSSVADPRFAARSSLT
jgi:hypothetical protein